MAPASTSISCVLGCVYSAIYFLLESWQWWEVGLCWEYSKKLFGYIFYSWCNCPLIVSYPAQNIGWKSQLVRFTLENAKYAIIFLVDAHSCHDEVTTDKISQREIPGKKTMEPRWDNAIFHHKNPSKENQLVQDKIGLRWIKQVDLKPAGQSNLNSVAATSAHVGAQASL